MASHFKTRDKRARIPLALNVATFMCHKHRGVCEPRKDPCIQQTATTPQSGVALLQVGLLTSFLPELTQMAFCRCQCERTCNEPAKQRHIEDCRHHPAHCGGQRVGCLRCMVVHDRRSCNGTPISAIPSGRGDSGCDPSQASVFPGSHEAPATVRKWIPAAPTVSFPTHLQTA